jgi:peptide/nickel transport system substrate-binding protein
MKVQRNVRSRWRRYVAVAVAGAIGIVSTGTGARAATSPTPKAGGELTVAIPSNFFGFCFTTTALVGPPLGAISSVIEPLFTKSPSGEAVGYLAKTATPSTDLKTWTIELRPGISYSNGQQFNADSVIENIDYARGAKFLTGGAAMAWTLSVGVAQYANILSVKKIDDTTVQFNLFRAQNDLPLSLTYAYMRASASLASSSACVNNPIGTGAFTLTNWSAADLVVDRNPNYWRTDPNRPSAKLPYLSRISFVSVTEGSQRAAAVRKGTVDAALMTGASEATFMKDLKLRKSVVKVYDAPIHYYLSAWLNQGNGGPFADINARQAVVRCIDRASYQKVRLKGTGQAATSLTGSLNVMYNTANFPKFDVTAAKGYVSAYLAAHPEKSRLEFTAPFDPSVQSQANATFLKSTFEKCGITMNIVSEQASVWATKAFNPVTGQNAYDMLVTALITETDAAINFPFFVTNAFPSDSTNPLKLFRASVGAVLGANHHTDATLDALAWQARAATTAADTKTAFKNLTAEIQNKAIMTTIVNYGFNFVTYNKSKIGGIGSLQFVKGTKVRPVTAQGVDWAGLYRG